MGLLDFLGKIGGAAGGFALGGPMGAGIGFGIGGGLGESLGGGSKDEKLSRLRAQQAMQEGSAMRDWAIREYERRQPMREMYEKGTMGLGQMDAWNPFAQVNPLPNLPYRPEQPVVPENEQNAPTMLPPRPPAGGGGYGGHPAMGGAGNFQNAPGFGMTPPAASPAVTPAAPQGGLGMLSQMLGQQQQSAGAALPAGPDPLAAHAMISPQSTLANRRVGYQDTNGVAELLAKLRQQYFPGG